MTNNFDWKLDLEITLKKECEPLLATQDNKRMLRDELIRMEEEMIEIIKQQVHSVSRKVLYD